VTGEYLSPDIRSFLSILAAHGVRYLIVGGEAVIYHGYARLTGDVDFFYDQSDDNVKRLHAALEEFWSGSIPGALPESALAQPGVVIQFGRPPNRIDLVASLGSLPFEEVWPNRVEDSLEADGAKVPVFIIGLSDLVRAKREAGRPKDLDDVEHLTGAGAGD